MEAGGGICPLAVVPAVDVGLEASICWASKDPCPVTMALLPNTTELAVTTAPAGAAQPTWVRRSPQGPRSMVLQWSGSAADVSQFE